MDTQVTKDQLEANPDVVKEMTVDEAKSLPGLLGRIAGAMLQAHGKYGYVNTATGEKVLLVRKAA